MLRTTDNSQIFECGDKLYKQLIKAILNLFKLREGNIINFLILNPKIYINILNKIVNKLFTNFNDLIDKSLYFGNIEEEHSLDRFYIFIHHFYQI